MAEAYIVAAVRTAGGRRDGKLKDWHPADLDGALQLTALVTLAPPTHEADVRLPFTVEKASFRRSRARPRWALATREGSEAKHIRLSTAFSSEPLVQIGKFRDRPLQSHVPLTQSHLYVVQWHEAVLSAFEHDRKQTVFMMNCGWFYQNAVMCLQRSTHSTSALSEAAVA